MDNREWSGRCRRGCVPARAARASGTMVRPLPTLVVLIDSSCAAPYSTRLIAVRGGARVPVGVRFLFSTKTALTASQFHCARLPVTLQCALHSTLVCLSAPTGSVWRHRRGGDPCPAARPEPRLGSCRPGHLSADTEHASGRLPRQATGSGEEYSAASSPLARMGGVVGV